MSEKPYIKILLYILSLWLLFISLSIMSYDTNLFKIIKLSFENNNVLLLKDNLKTKNIVFIISLTFILSGFIIYYIFSCSVTAGWSTSVHVKNISNESHEHLEFLATYVMPLVFTDVNSKRTVLNLFLMIIAIGAIYIKTNKFYSNPSLAILGFKIYKGTINDRGEKNMVIIIKGNIKENSIIQYIKIDEFTCLAKNMG